MKTKSKEGFIPFRGYRTWYRIVGEDTDGRTPLLCLHGGPGCPHDYLEPLEAVAETGRRVVFYDQLGCGNSDQPHDPSLWTMELFLDELTTIRRELDLNRIHLLGQSWGGMLALEYLLGKPEGVQSLVLASSLASARQWAAEANRLRSELPPDARNTLDRHEADGTTNSPEYEQAMALFYHRHICRMDPWHECLMRSLKKFSANPEVYVTLWGPSEFHVTGTLRHWSVADRLGEIEVPTLITSGRYDESTPAINEILRRGIPNAEHVLFENSAHESHVEEADLYVRILAGFLARVEAAAR